MTVLDNGLTVISRQIPSRLAEAELCFRIGAVHDSIPGISHLLEHVLVGGPAAAKRRPDWRKGIREGTSFGGHTGMNSVTLDAYGLADQWESMIGFLLRAASFDATKTVFRKERAVVLEETRLRFSEDARFSWICRSIFPKRSALRRMDYGTEESVGRITLDDLRAFHSLWFGAKNAALITSGGIRHEDAVAAAARCQFPTAERTMRVMRKTAPRKVRTFTDDIPGAGPEISFYVPIPTEAAERQKIDAIVEILAGVESESILNRRTRYHKHPVYAIEVQYLEPLIARCLMFTLHVSKPDNLEEMEKIFCGAVAELVAGSYDRDVLESVKNRILIEAIRREESIGCVPDAATLRMRWLFSDRRHRIVEEKPLADIVGTFTPEVLSASAERHLVDKHGLLAVFPYRIFEEVEKESGEEAETAEDAEPEEN